MWISGLFRFFDVNSEVVNAGPVLHAGVAAGGRIGRRFGRDDDERHFGRIGRNQNDFAAENGKYYIWQLFQHYK